MHARLSRCSRDLRYLWANQPYADWLDRPLDEIVGRRIVDVLGPQAFQALKDRFDHVLAGQNVVFDQEVVFDRIGRGYISAAYSPTFDSSGIVDGWVSVVQDVTELKKASQLLLGASKVFTRSSAGQNRLPKKILLQKTLYYTGPLSQGIMLYHRSSLPGIMAVSPGSIRFPASRPRFGRKASESPDR